METESRRYTHFNLIVSLVSLVLLSPVIGMVIVFAILPSLPIVIAIGIGLGPMTLLRELEQPKAEEARHAPYVGHLAHA